MKSFDLRILIIPINFFVLAPLLFYFTDELVKRNINARNIGVPIKYFFIMCKEGNYSKILLSLLFFGILFLTIFVILNLIK